MNLKILSFCLLAFLLYADETSQELAIALDTFSVDPI
jgi:hypothetical protein